MQNVKQTKILFLDRDGTLVLEPPDDYQLDSYEKLEFYPGIFYWLGRIVRELDYELVMITNQDGLGTDSFPEDTFWGPHRLMLKTFANEGITFREVLIDRSFPAEGKDTRKPGTGLLGGYLDGSCDLANSFVIGDRLTDMMLAKNLGSGGIWLANNPELGADELADDAVALDSVIARTTTSWEDIYTFLRRTERTADISRETAETNIHVKLDLDGSGQSDIQTGLGFFDHMLDQIARHSGCDLYIRTKGDLEIDEHHTIEDTALALGTAFRQALGDKRGIERYGYCLPMDDALATVALDFGGRNWLVWEADFRREYIGDMPTEMFRHFFKSFTDTAKCNLFVRVQGENEHHKIEAIFKAFARSIRMAIRKEVGSDVLPSTKNVIE